MVFDVAIAGGGIIGAAIGWELTRRGATVCIVETSTIGAEASWAGAGMLSPGSEFSVNPEMERFARESLAMYPEFVGLLEQESGRHVDFRLCGALDLYFDEIQPGGESRILTRNEVIRLAPGIHPEVQGAIFHPSDGQVDPRTLMPALRQALLRRKATVIEGQSVIGIRPTELLTPAGPIPAKAIVVAGGAWSSQISTPGERLPESFPIKGHLLGYHWAAGSIPGILRYDHTYVVQRETGFTIIGATEERVGFDRRVDAAEIEGLRHRAARILPQISVVAPDEAWIGFRPATPSLLPEIRRWGEHRIWLAYGHYRNGILLAPATARRVAGEILAAF
jgi:glycine oxidase